MTSGSKFQSNGESAKEVKKREDKTGRRDEDVEVLFGRDVDGWGLHVSDIRDISSKCVCSKGLG